LFLPVTRAVLAALAALLVSAPAAHAAAFPTELPGDVTASSVRADPDTWIVGAKPSGAAARIAERHFRLTESVLRDLVSTIERTGGTEP